MTRNEKIIVGIGLGIAAIAVSADLRRFALEAVKLAMTPRLPASDATLDVEWIEIDVSDLTLH